MNRAYLLFGCLCITILAMVSASTMIFLSDRELPLRTTDKQYVCLQDIAKGVCENLSWNLSGVKNQVRFFIDYRIVCSDNRGMENKIYYFNEMELNRCKKEVLPND